ncbi:MAG: hypothetical protein HOV83_23870 [Catenulispora sp.]|nr:hypothetical protein [Catenulispora sp.]
MKMSHQEALAQSRYRHPSRASLRAETARNARRDRNRKAALAVGAVGAVGAAAAGLVSAYRMMRGARR